MQRRTRSGAAIASLIVGITGALLAVFLLVWVPQVPFSVAGAAVIVGHVALADIRRGCGSVRGRGMAITGLALGYLIAAACLAWFIDLVTHL